MLEQMPAYSWNGSVFTINYPNSGKVLKEGSQWVSVEYFDEESKRWVYKYYDDGKKDFITAIDDEDEHFSEYYLNENGKFSSAF